MDIGQRFRVLVFALFVVAVIVALCFVVGYVVGKVFL